jgi:hypothetical protein
MLVADPASFRVVSQFRFEGEVKRVHQLDS